MESSAVAELEHLLRSPPPTMSLPQPHQQHAGHLSNPVALAHAVLEAIREAGDENFLFLRCVIELSRPRHPRGSDNGAPPAVGLQLDPDREELFFHCATGCRQAALWQWKRLSDQFLGSVRDYLMALGHELGNGSSSSSSREVESPASRTCRLACYAASVALWKRGWDEEDLDEEARSSHHPPSPGPREGALVADMRSSLVLLAAGSSAPLPLLAGKSDLARYLESLFLHRPEQAATFSQILVGEFSGKSAVSYRLPLEFHKTAHLSFEKSALLQILQMSMKALARAMSALGGFSVAAVAGENDEAAAMAAAMLLEEARAVVQLTADSIGWEFGTSAWDPGSAGGAAALATTARALIRPPHEWKPVIVQPDLVRAAFHLHHHLFSQQQRVPADSKLSLSMDRLAQSLRQLLLQLASLSGSVFSHPSERRQYAFPLTEGTLQLLERSAHSDATDKPELLDALQLVARIVSNFRLATLVEIPALWSLLQGVASLGTRVLVDQTEECRRAGGDLEAMEHREWREDVLSLLLACAVLLCGDPWLLYSGTDESRGQARTSLSGVLGPLYEGYVRCRTTMAALEEGYAVAEGDDIDDVREAIATTDLEDEIGLVSVIGRLNLSAAIACLSTLFGQIKPALGARPDVRAEAQIASTLEESRIIIMYVCQLLTDDNKGEAPTIPDQIVIACHETPARASEISGALRALMSFAESQVQSIVSDPSNRLLSPMMAKTFLWFLSRWAPAYVYPTDFGESNSSNPIIREWSSPGRAVEAISYSVTLCLHYQCYWPQEPQVQQSAGDLLMSLAKRKGSFRSTLVATSAFATLVRFHCLTAGVRHIASHKEFNSIILSRVGASSPPSMDLLWGYQRLPYPDKARILSAILVGCSDASDSTATAMLSESLKVLHESFEGYIEAISTNRVGPDDIHAKEMACLCIEMFCGVVNASEMEEAHRIPQFVTPHLFQLADLMKFYADDLTVGESLLRFFRDFTVNFIVALDREQSLALFRASADVLKNYSSHHCERRVIRKKTSAEVEAEEEQEYSDILCAIQLLVNLSARDFFDAFDGEQSAFGILCFGLQQILPLMTQGLLQFPTLCHNFFELVGFVMDTYPEKVCKLPYDFFNSLLESLLFGMSHYNAAVSNSSLHGIASIAKEQIETQALQNHLLHHPDIFDRISHRLLADVVFQSVVVDRVEAAGMALLPVAAVDVNRFAGVVHDLTAQAPDEGQRQRLQAAFQKLMQPDVLAKAASSGYEGRLNRARFKKGFEHFVNEVHSFLVLR